MEQLARKDIEYDENTIDFQALEWVDTNEGKISDDDDMMVDDECEIPEEYVIRCFGATKEGNSVCLTITDFTPFFYVKIPEVWGKNNVNLFLSNLINLTGYYNGRAYSPLKKWGQYLLREKCLIQRKKDFYGFSGEKQFKFLRLTFDNSVAMKKFVYAINSHNDVTNKTNVSGINFKLKLYESNLDPVLKFMHIKDIKPTGWINAKNITVVEGLAKASRCQIEICAKWTDIACNAENESNARILQASFDIEAYSIDGSFPLPTVSENCMTQIATAFKYFGDSEFYVKHIITLKQCAEIISQDGIPVIVESYETEKEVLLAWKRLVNKMDPDILYTYNGDQFDCNYLNERAKINRCSEEFLDLSKLKESSSILKEAQFSSSAYGTSNYKRLSIPGRINFDLLIYIQREYKENSYKLDSIAEKYLGQKKNDMTHQQMFDFFAGGDPEKIKTLAKYCIQDTLLPQLLVDKLHILQNQISMSNVTYVPIKYLIERGQSIKAFSQILRETRKAGYLVPVIERNQNEGSFEGATVLAPDTGAYFSPVTVCDFASLYPSIIRAHNLCFSTIVLNEEYDNLPDTEYSTLSWTEESDASHSFRYCQSTEGILPKLLKELTESREKYKQLMKTAEDPFTKEIYNKCQLAVKVSMNSIYGFLAAPMLTCKGIAATVTAYGREMIADTKKFMEQEYPCSVAVYGDTDSVFVKFKTKNTDFFNSEYDRIYSHVVVTDGDKEYLRKLKSKCIEESKEMGKEAALAATKKLFKFPISLEYEKVYCPLLLLSKKRYIGELYSENSEKMDYLDNKGVVLKRRDNFELLRICYQKMVDIFVEDGEKGLDKALAYIRTVIDDIKNGTVDKDLLVVTKTLKGPYKSMNIPHVVLAKTLAERDPGNAPRSNDRIPYIFIDNGWLKATTPQYTKVECPQYAKQHSLPVDTEYYIKYLMNPICEILELFMDNPQEMFKKITLEYRKERLARLKNL